MVENIFVSDNLNLFELDIDFFKKTYPSIYEQNRRELEYLDYSEIERIALDSGSVIKQESVVLWLSNNTTEVIYNTDILSWYGYEYIDGYTVNFDSRFVYFILSPTWGQVGSLGIWDISKKDWIFNHNDEGFCIEAILYDNVLDAFIGYYEWNIPMSPQHGESFFMIDKNRSYRELEVEKIYDASSRTNFDADYLDGYMPLNMDMKSQFSNNSDMWLIVDIKQKLAIVNDHNQKKILSAYKLQTLRFV
jgi:hypothetical protein